MLDVSSNDVEQIKEEINEVIQNVTTGLVTYSIRDASLEGIEIKKNDYIGIVNGKMVASTANKVETVKAMLKATDMSVKEIITVIYGADATREEVDEVIAFINSEYPDIETDVIEGNQDVYSFILSIE